MGGKSSKPTGQRSSGTNTRPHLTPSRLSHQARESPPGLGPAAAAASGPTGSAGSHSTNADATSRQAADARHQQELEDEALARRLLMEEITAFGGQLPPLGPHQARGGSNGASSSRSEAPSARASCPFCGMQNEFMVSSESGPVAIRCGSCASQFQVDLSQMPLPHGGAPGDIGSLGGSRSGAGRGGGHNSMQMCRQCGTWNQFPTPDPGQPTPNVLCGFCGAFTPVSQRSARWHRSLERTMNAQGLLDSRAALARHGGGPMVRVNVGGQRRALLLTLMAQEGEQGNPAHAADIAALPTRKLGESENLGEQNKCLICLDEFNDGDDVKTLPCLHIYHQKCVERWLGTDNSCPVCKTPIGDVRA